MLGLPESSGYPQKINMEIEVRLFATLQVYLQKRYRKHSFKMNIETGTTIGSALKKLKIPEQTPKILLVDGKCSSEDTILEQGNTLSVFPPVGGG